LDRQDLKSLELYKTHAVLAHLIKCRACCLSRWMMEDSGRSWTPRDSTAGLKERWYIPSGTWHGAEVEHFAAAATMAKRMVF
jgi:hypothetical protein